VVTYDNVCEVRFIVMYLLSSQSGVALVLNLELYGIYITLLNSKYIFNLTQGCFILILMSVVLVALQYQEGHVLCR
jgi:hypothetical protein